MSEGEEKRIREIFDATIALHQRVAGTVAALVIDAAAGAALVPWTDVRVDSADSHLARTVRHSLTDLRHLLMAYVGFDGRTHNGEMVVHRDYARQVVSVFKSLYDA